MTLPLWFWLAAKLLLFTWTGFMVLATAYLAGHRSGYRRAVREMKWAQVRRDEDAAAAKPVRHASRLTAGTFDGMN